MSKKAETKTRLRMPAEWNPHAAIWLSWPHNAETWPRRLAEAQSEFTQLATTIASETPVMIAGGGGDATQSARKRFSNKPNIEVHDIATNDAWIRDYGPTFVIDAETNSLNAVDWVYNAWGGKYPPFDDDQKVARRIAGDLGIDCFSLDFCFEGGAIEINDAGIVLSTRSCALDPNRNPNIDLQTIEEIFERYLGATRTVWLAGGGVEGDDTDGHIDQLARFTSERTIVYAWTDDTTDPQHTDLLQNLSDLRRGLENADGEFKLIPLPLPAVPIVVDDSRLPACYCNFLITGKLVVVPQFDDPHDEVAIETLQQLFPDSSVIGLPSKFLVAGLGSFHCLSQQQPRV